MAEEVLVKEQIDGGRKLLDRLLAADVHLTVAFWCKPEDDQYWHLYLVSPDVKDRGTLPVYAVANQLINTLPWASDRERIDPSSLRVVHTSNWLAQNALPIARAYPPGVANIWYRAKWFGDAAVEGTYIYPLPQPAPATA